MGTTQATISTV